MRYSLYSCDQSIHTWFMDFIIVTQILILTLMSKRNLVKMVMNKGKAMEIGTIKLLLTKKIIKTKLEHSNMEGVLWVQIANLD